MDNNTSSRRRTQRPYEGERRNRRMPEAARSASRGRRNNIRRHTVSQGTGRRGENSFLKKLPLYGTILVLAVVVVILAVNIFKPKTFAVESGAMSFQTDANGIMIKNETLYSAEGYGRADYVAQDGQFVQTGTLIAEVYSNDYTDNDYNTLKELREKILDYQQNNAQTGVIDQDMASLDEQINRISDQIRKVISREQEGDLRQLQIDITRLMDERSNIMRSAAKEDSQLSSYYEQERTLVEKIKNYRRDLIAEKDGMVSFYFDGTETVLSPSTMGNLTVKTINNILSGRLGIDLSNTVKPLYKIVDRNDWYIAVLMDKAVPEFIEEQKYVVAFTFGNDYTYEGRLVSHVEDNGKFIYIFNFQENIDKLLRARRISCNISVRYTGLQVDSKVVKVKDGQTGVYYLKDGEKTFEPVDVLITQGGKSIIKVKDSSSALKDGSEVFF